MGENKNYLHIAPGVTLTVADGGVLSVGAGVFNEGTIKVEKGGTMIVKEGAYVGPQEYGQKLGNIVCDGGDLIVMPGAKVFLEGAAGLKLDNNAHLVNQGLIVTGNAKLQNSVVENPGALYTYSAVKPDKRGEFMDWEVRLSNGGADYPGATGWGGALLLSGQASLTTMVGYQSVWTGNYVNAKT